MVSMQYCTSLRKPAACPSAFSTAVSWTRARAAQSRQESLGPPLIDGAAPHRSR